MKNFFAFLGVIFAIILVTVGVLAAIFIPRAMRLNHEAIAYIDNAVPKIVTHWNAQELLNQASRALLKTVKSRAQVDALFMSYYQRFGALKHLDAPKGMALNTRFFNWFKNSESNDSSNAQNSDSEHQISTAGKNVTFGEYVIGAEFTKGSATIIVQLQRKNDRWKINGFRIFSNASLK